MAKKKKKSTQPQWMKDRIKHVTYLRTKGYNSCLLAHSIDADVKKWYKEEQEKNNGTT